MSTGSAFVLLRVRVASKTLEATGIVSFELVSADGVLLPAFEAGAHIDVTPAPGLTRPYSLCNHPAERGRYQIAVLLEPQGRGGSTAMHALEVGDEIAVGAPRNDFPLAPGAHPSLLMAGGIGITPLLCMAEHLNSAGQPFEMHYCTRSRDRAAFAGRIAQSAYADRVHLHIDDAPAQRLALPELLQRTPAGTHLYVCGPKGFIDAALNAARAAGHADASLHHEVFGAQLVKFDSDDSFDLQLARSGRTITVAKHQTAVDALAQAGVEVPTSCEQGLCGTCLTQVLQGEPDHRDTYLTPAERAGNRLFLPCCSRSRTSTLVLDL